MDTVDKLIEQFKFKIEDTNSFYTLTEKKWFKYFVLELEQLREEQKPEANPLRAKQSSFLKGQEPPRMVKEAYLKLDEENNNLLSEIAKLKSEQLQPQQEAVELLKELFEQYELSVSSSLIDYGLEFAEHSKNLPTYQKVKKFLSEADKGEPK